MLKFNDSRDWFLDKKLGMFIHFGLYSIGGWHEQDQWRREIPREDYEKLIDKFNPTEFDPHKWIDAAESAGMEFLCITTKHHDGFCLWDTKYTDFNVMNSPYKKDIIKMTSDACHERGMGFGVYYSLPDWHNKYYPTQGRHHEIYMPRETDEPSTEKYLEYVKNQVVELCTNYGEINQFFWDVNVAEFNDPSINNLIRKLQPGALINDRGPSKGDFTTPERTVPYDGCFKEPVMSIQSMGRESWGYRIDEDYYTHKFLMQSIDKSLVMGGNYELNIGPKPDGTFAKEDIDACNAIGEWYKKVKESYKDIDLSCKLNADCDGSTIGYDNCGITISDNTMYLHINKDLQTCGLMLAPIDILPKEAIILNTGESVKCIVDIVPWRYTKNPALRLAKIPVNKILDEPIVIKLKFDKEDMSYITNLLNG